MFVNKTNTYKHHNRFSAINPGKMGRSFWQAHNSDGGGSGGDNKYTLDEAREKLKADGFAVMKQTAFDEILNEKFGKGFSKGKDEASNALSDEQRKWKEAFDKLPGIQRKLEEATKDKPDMISKSEHEQLLKVEQEKHAKTQEEVSNLKRFQLDNEILKTISPKAVNPEDVLALTRGQFQLDENGKIYPINEKGEKLIDSDGHMTPDRYFDKFFKEKPYLAKASDSQGAGSQSQGAGNNGKAAKGIDGLIGLDQAALAKELGLE